MQQIPHTRRYRNKLLILVLEALRQGYSGLPGLVARLREQGVRRLGESEDRSERPNRRVSVMRRFLESGVDFEWPDGMGKRDSNHCTLNSGPGHHIPLIWKSRISDKKASIDIYVGGDQYAFKKTFAMEKIREETHKIENEST